MLEGAVAEPDRVGEGCSGVAGDLANPLLHLLQRRVPLAHEVVVLEQEDPVVAAPHRHHAGEAVAVGEEPQLVGVGGTAPCQPGVDHPSGPALERLGLHRQPELVAQDPGDPVGADHKAGTDLFALAVLLVGVAVVADHQGRRVVVLADRQDGATTLDLVPLTFQHLHQRGLDHVLPGVERRRVGAAGAAVLLPQSLAVDDHVDVGHLVGLLRQRLTHPNPGEQLLRASPQVVRRGVLRRLRPRLEQAEPHTTMRQGASQGQTDRTRPHDGGVIALRLRPGLVPCRGHCTLLDVVMVGMSAAAAIVPVGLQHASSSP